MKAYGTEHQRHFYRDEDFSPTSKYRKISSKNRIEWRRILHKKARNLNNRLLRKELFDI
jgi:hypothetical protein